MRKKKNYINSYGKPEKSPYRDVSDQIINHWTIRNLKNFTNVYVVKAPSADEALEIANVYIDVEGYSCACSHDCCGHVYIRPAYVIRISSGRYAVVQNGGKNV